MKKPIFILSFLASYWPILLVCVVLGTASHYDRITYFIGPVFYVLLLLVICLAGAFLCKHMGFRRSIDAYTQKKDADGNFEYVKDFWALPPQQRVWLTVIVTLVFFIGACWIAASLAK